MNQWIRFVMWIFLITLLGSGGGAMGAPREIAGIVLGDSVDKYAERLRMDTAQPIRQTDRMAR